MCYLCYQKLCEFHSFFVYTSHCSSFTPPVTEADTLPSRMPTAERSCFVAPPFVIVLPVSVAVTTFLMHAQLV